MISGDDATSEDQGNRLMEGKDEGLDMKVKPTFDETTIFQFYSKSSDKPLPGRGAGEKINPKKQKKFSELVALVGWRKVLSNFHMEQFKLDGKTWNSVDHYYHANKFKKGHPKFYDLFAVESGSKISKSAAFAKSAGGKTGKYKSENWKRDKKITMDEDFFSGRNQIAMEAGQQAKYSQNEIPKKVLLATKDAKLRSEMIAKSSNSILGKLLTAQMGVFQIIAKNSTENYSWGGSHNKTSKHKTATVTMKLEYSIEG